MRAFVTVFGRDSKGIIAAVSSFLSERNINILDISQTILGENFAMVMLVDTADCAEDFTAVAGAAEEMGERIGMTVRFQHEEIFNAMHRV